MVQSTNFFLTIDGGYIMMSAWSVPSV